MRVQGTLQMGCRALAGRYVWSCQRSGPVANSRWCQAHETKVSGSLKTFAFLSARLDCEAVA